MSEENTSPQIKISRFQALAACKCPACRVGKLFSGKTYDFNTFEDINKTCSHCGQDFVIEPGFYLAGTYIAYGFYVMVIMSIVGAYFLFFDFLSEWLLMGILIVVCFALLPLTFRYSRILLLHFFAGISYNPQLLDGPDVESNIGQ